MGNPFGIEYLRWMLIALWFPVCEICFDYTNFALELNTLKFELWEHIEPNKKALWLISWYIMNISLRLALPTLPICNANICLCSMSSSPLSAVDWLCSIGLAIRKSLELVYRLVKSFAVWNNVEKWNGMGKVDTIHPRQWIPPSLLSAEFYGISFGFKMKHFTFVSIFDVFEALLNWWGWSEDHHHITSHRTTNQYIYLEWSILTTDRHQIIHATLISCIWRSVIESTRTIFILPLQ